MFYTYKMSLEGTIVLVGGDISIVPVLDALLQLLQFTPGSSWTVPYNQLTKGLKTILLV